MFRSSITRQFAELVFPNQCPFCHVQNISSDTAPNDFAGQQELWCDDCFKKLVGHSLDRCEKCGATSGKQNPFPAGCKLCHGFDFKFERCFAVGNYRGPLQQLVIEVKRQHNEVVANQLGRLLGKQLELFDVRNIDLVVPVPTHWWRKFSRGFHATSVISDGVASAIGLPRPHHALFCNRKSKKQGTLSTPARFTNVRNSFGVNSRTSVSGKRILLVDDVMTSGATASEAARTLVRAGADSVVAAVIARGARVS